MEANEPDTPTDAQDAPAHYAERTGDPTSPQTGDGATPDQPRPEANEEPEAEAGSEAPAPDAGV
jgi:hypothetical protein